MFVQFGTFRNIVGDAYKGKNNQAKRVLHAVLKEANRTGVGFDELLPLVRSHALDSAQREGKTFHWRGGDLNLLNSFAGGDGDRAKAAAFHFFFLCRSEYRKFGEKLSRAINLDQLLEGKITDPVYVLAPPDTLAPSPGTDVPVAPSGPFHWPLYVTSESAMSGDGDPGVWLNPLNHYSMPLSGRAEERRLLDSFMSDARPFLICALVAPSGAGKTRLVSEWMRTYLPSADQTQWDAGFVTDRDPQAWSQWSPIRSTLLIIDYTYAYDDVMRAIAERFRYYREPGASKVRLLVVDHIYPTVLQNDVFWSRSFSDQRVVDSLKSSILYGHSPIELRPEKANSLTMRSVIAAAASSPLVRYTESDRLVIEAEATLSRMAAASSSPDAVRHPLFAALMGQAIREGRTGYENWSRRDLLKHYFDRPLRLPWRAQPGETDERGLWIGAYVAAATLLRGVSFSSLRHQLPRGGSKARGFEASYLEQAANRLVSSLDGITLHPLEPDILGENFLLLFFAAIDSEDHVFNSFVSMLETADRGDDGRASGLSFLETLQRLTRNLLNDDQSLRSVVDAWSALDEFLTPERTAEEGLLRPLVSLARADIVQQCHQASLPDRAGQFARKIERRGLIDAVSGAFWPEATTVAFRFMEWLFTSGLERPGDRDAALALAATYRELSATNGVSGLLPAAWLGCTQFVALLLNAKEDVNARGRRGWTPVMIAASGQHKETVALLLSAGADPHLGKIEGGWRALTIASAAGETAIVEALLAAGADPASSVLDDGRTALSLALQGSKVGTVRALLMDGTDPWINYHDWSSFMIL